MIPLDWIALAIGTIGTICWASNTKYTKYASLLWLASSLIWLIFAYTNNLEALGIRDAINIGLYVYGAYRWFSPSCRQSSD